MKIFPLPFVVSLFFFAAAFANAGVERHQVSSGLMPLPTEISRLHHHPSLSQVYFTRQKADGTQTIFGLNTSTGSVSSLLNDNDSLDVYSGITPDGLWLVQQDAEYSFWSVPATGGTPVFCLKKESIPPIGERSLVTAAQWCSSRIVPCSVCR
jgi:hypothetical protein